MPFAVTPCVVNPRPVRKPDTPALPGLAQPREAKPRQSSTRLCCRCLPVRSEPSLDPPLLPFQEPPGIAQPLHGCLVLPCPTTPIHRGPRHACAAEPRPSTSRQPSLADPATPPRASAQPCPASSRARRSPAATPLRARPCITHPRLPRRSPPRLSITSLASPIQSSAAVTFVSAPRQSPRSLASPACPCRPCTACRSSRDPSRLAEPRPCCPDVPVPFSTCLSGLSSHHLASPRRAGPVPSGHALQATPFAASPLLPVPALPVRACPSHPLLPRPTSSWTAHPCRQCLSVADSPFQASAGPSTPRFAWPCPDNPFQCCLSIP